MLALSVNRFSLIGVFKQQFPVKYGNYFSVNSDDGNSYDVVNMFYENIVELDIVGISFPYKISINVDGKAIICDDRILGYWYNNKD